MLKHWRRSWFPYIISAVVVCSFILIKFRQPARPISIVHAQLPQHALKGRKTAKKVVAKAAEKKANEAKSEAARLRRTMAVVPTPSIELIEKKVAMEVPAIKAAPIAAKTVSGSSIKKKAVIAAHHPAKVEVLKKKTALKVVAQAEDVDESDDVSADDSDDENDSEIAEGPTFTKPVAVAKPVRAFPTAVVPVVPPVPTFDLNKFTEAAFDEPSLSSDYAANSLTSPTQEDLGVLVDSRFPKETRYNVIFGTFQKYDFPELRSLVDQMKAIKLERIVAPPSPQFTKAPELVRTPPSKVNEPEDATETEETTPAAEEPVASKSVEKAIEPAISPVQKVTEATALKPPAPEVSKVEDKAPKADVSAPPAEAEAEAQAPVAESAPAAGSAPNLVASAAATEVEEVVADSTVASQETSEAPSTPQPVLDARVDIETVKTLPAPTLVTPATQGLKFGQVSTPAPTQISQVTPANPAAPPARRVAPPVEVAQKTNGRGSEPDPISATRAELASVAPAPLPATRAPSIITAKVERDASTTSQREKPEPVDIVNGDFSLDPRVAEWITKHFGTDWHIELHLDSLERTDRQPGDLNFVQFFKFTSKDLETKRFEIPANKIDDGAYQLIARVYARRGRHFENNGADLTVPVRPIASIPYDRESVDSSYRAVIPFHVTPKMFFDAYRASQHSPYRKNRLTVSVFEAASADYQKPNARIAGARVWVDDNTTIPMVRTNKKGYAELTVPSNSTLKLVVEHDDYVPTQQTIYSSDEYAVVYLIHKSVVNTTTNHITFNQQDPEKSILMGRVLKNLKPAANVVMSLMFRRGPALYIEALQNPWLRDILPNPMLPATTSTGLFAYFNVGKHLRTLFHSLSKIPAVINAKAGSGYFEEFGRGPDKTIQGRYWDSINGVAPHATVKFYGQVSDFFEVYDNGKFSVTTDLPAGQPATLQVEAEHYPTTLHQVAVEPPGRSAYHTFFMLDEQVLKDSALEFGRQKSIDPKKGQVIGGAEPELFKNTSGCLRVTLTSLDQKREPGIALTPVSQEHGPSTWGKPLVGPVYRCRDKRQEDGPFYNVDPGEYSMKWIDSDNAVVRQLTFFVEANMTSIVY